jgi:hypothetical protein
MPFKSRKQQKYMYAHPDILGKKGLEEWSSKTNFKKLPEKVSVSGLREADARQILKRDRS